jgi:hypothetical protein
MEKGGGFFDLLWCAGQWEEGEKLLTVMPGIKV